MEFSGTFQPEIVAYIDLRIKEHADDSTIKSEIKAKWPQPISEDGIADHYILHARQKAPPVK